MADSTTVVQSAQAHTVAPTHSRRHIQWSAYLYILPAYIIIAMFHIIPVFYAIYISLNKGPINKFVWVGFDHYL
ncbi:MAG: hypothetical protein AB1817_10640, partial [Chloroflexota bacterium]